MPLPAPYPPLSTGKKEVSGRSYWQGIHCAQTGTSIGAAMLFDSKDAEITDSEPHRSNAPLVDTLQAYVTRWKASVRAGTDDAFNN